MKKTFSAMININNKYCRSVNINHDFDDIDILKTLICPTSFKMVIETMLDNIVTTRQSAFTWTGPYGAGKSSLALLLTALIGKGEKSRGIAESIIGNSLSKRVYSKLAITKGWKVLPLVGELDSIENIIIREIENDTGEQVEDLFISFLKYLEKHEGLLLVIDEMGKCLEAAARNSMDIFFYQRLAEFASRSNGKFVVIGILHQSFVDYARYLPYTLKDEWIKVQGRYMDLPINTAGEEQMELISRAIKSTKHDGLFITAVAERTVATISRNKKIASEKALVEKLVDCWPISPVVIVLLCQLSRKRFGQNQRSIFSFLASGEPMALRDFINNNEYSDRLLYMPSDLFDYIRINLESALLASSDSKLWHMAIDALSKCQARGFSELHLNILKTIAVIDLFLGASGIVSNIELLEGLYQSNSINILDIMNDLKSLSVIIYKKHINAYSIYEGSDFDIDKAIEEAYSDENNFDINKLVEIANFKPIIAKRYYHKFGSLRWFDVILAPTDECYYYIKKEKNNSKAVGLFVILLPTTIEDEAVAQEIINNNGIADFPVVFTIAENTHIINEYLQELVALEWIQNNRNELAGDSIARREVEDRKQLLNSYLETQLNKILVDSSWYIDGNKIQMKLNELSILASNICEKVYDKSPIIKSELINREKPSGNANAALYALLKDMVLSGSTNNLGLEGFTPEKGLYNILLKDTGIHKQNGKGIYTFCEPKNNNLKPLWEFNDEYLGSGKTTPILDLYEQWSREPFGIKNGLFSFLLLSYILTRKNIIAVYRDGIYNAEISDLLVEHIYSNPKIVAIKYIKSNIVIHDVINALVMVINEIYNENVLDVDSKPLVIAQKLVMLIDNLHPWVLKTKSLSKKTIQFREIIKSSNDPNKLIFEDILKLFGLDELHDGLKNTIYELINAYHSMIQSIGILLTSELDIPLATPFLIEKLRKRAKNITGIAGDFQIDAFAARLSTFNSSVNDIVGIISLANSKPQKDWIDLDIENAKKEILRLCTEFKKAELYTKVKNRPATRQAIAFISGIGGKSEITVGEFDILVDNSKDVRILKTKIKQLCQNEKDLSLVLTALAETSIDYLRIKNEQ
jgi:hypothetical protein